MVAEINNQLGAVGQMMPNLNITGVSMFLDIVVIFVGLLLLIIIAAIVTYFIYRRMKYNKEIIIFESVNNQWTPTKKDRACEIKIGKTGDTIFYLLKAKRPIPKPLYQEGYNKYWMARQGDELIDFNIEDIDFKTRLMKVKIPRQELLLSRISIHDALDKRSQEPFEWLKKHLGTILNIILLLIFGIVVWLWFDKIIALSAVEQTNAQNWNLVMQSMKNVSDSFNQILVKFDNIVTKNGVTLLWEIF